MPQKYFHKSFSCTAVAINDVPWKSNWDQDQQPELLPLQSYIELAVELRLTMLKKIKELMLLAPHAVLKDDGERKTYRLYKLDDMDQLIEAIEKNPQDQRFLKSQASAERKLWDGNIAFSPAKIGDYLRFQLLSDNIAEIVTLRAAILSQGSDLTSYKDQFRRPCKEGGHRAFKFHLKINDGQDSMIAEGQVGHLGLEGYELPKTLRDSERSIGDIEKSGKSGALRPVLQSAINQAASTYRALRRAINYDKCSQLGLDALLDSDISSEREIQMALEEFQKGSVHAAPITGHSNLIPNALASLTRH